MFKFTIYNINFCCEIKSQIIQEFLYEKFGHFDFKNNNEKLIGIIELETKDWITDDENVEHVRNTIIFYDRNELCVYFCVKNNGNADYITAQAILLEYILGILSENNIYYLHASSTTVHQSPQNGLILTGNPGAGKTTLMLKLLERDEKPIADDMLFFTIDNNKNPILLANKMAPRLFQKNLDDNFKLLNQNIKFKGKYKTSININSTYSEITRPKYILFLYNDGFLVPSIKRITQIEAFKKILPQIKLSKVFDNKKYLESISILIDLCVFLEVHIVKNVDQNIRYILDYLSQTDLEKDGY